MRIKRATVVAIIILTLFMMSVPSVAQGQTSALYPIVVALNNVDTVFIAAHTSSEKDGNWIELGGGTSVTLPSVTLIYDGLSAASYTKGQVTVEIDSSFDQGQAIYPIATHQVYSPLQPISATFWGATALSGSVEFKLLKLTSLTEARDIFNETFYGNLTPLRDKLDGATWNATSTLDGNGDAMANIPGQTVGDYLLLVIREETGPYELYIYSATAIEVVDYTLQVSAPSRVKRGDNVNVNLELLSAPDSTYIYGAVMVKKTAYSGEIKLSTDGTVINTAIHLNNKLIANGALASELILGNMDLSDVLDYALELMAAFESSEITYGYGLTFTSTGYMSLPTSSLSTGDYVLLVGVFKDLGDRVVGLQQTNVRIYTPSAPAPAINRPPVAEAGPHQIAWVDRAVYFDGSDSHDPDGYITSWTWNFGDGETASGETVTHEYSEPGNYLVTLTVKDSRLAVVSDTCVVEISEPPAPVSDEYAERVAAGEEGHVVDASDEANTTVTLTTTDPVTVTVLKYEDNPHPEDPLPAMALPNYVDVQVSNPDAVDWPIYVEMSYTDDEIGRLDENTFGIYYWMDDVWQRCSDTGVDTERNVVWAYMTAEEASGSPIVIAGMHAITPPPLPPIFSNLVITPVELERGEDVTISFDIMNTGSQSLTYGVDIHIENVNDPPPTWPPYHVTPRIWVELEAYESKTVSHTITMDAVGDFDVTVHRMTGSFKVGTWPPLKPAEFVVSDLNIEPEEVTLEEGINDWTFEITVDVTNIGEAEGSHTVDLKVDGDVIQTGTVTLWGGEETSITFDVTRGVGVYAVEIAEITGSFEVKPYLAPLKPAEFVVSDVALAATEIEPGGTIIVSVMVANIGETEGTYTVEFKVDGETVESESVTLAGGASQEVSFLFSSDEEGEHTVEIDGVSGSFTVESPPPKKPIWPTIILIVAVVAVLIYLIWIKTDWIQKLIKRTL